MIRIMNKRTYKGPGEYCGRPSALGNPFSHIPTGTLAKFVVANRDEAVDRYEGWLKEQWNGNNEPVKAALKQLVYKYRANHELTLVCWCAPLRCHCSVIAKYVELLDKQI